MKAFLTLLLLFFELSNTATADDCQRLTAGGIIEYPPFMWQSLPPNEQVHGALVTLAQQVGELAGVHIETIYTGSWARTQQEFSHHHFDLMNGVFFNQDRAAIMDYLRPPMSQSNVHIWVHQDSSLKLHSIQQLQGLTGATLRQFSLGQEFDQFARDKLNIIKLNSIRQGFKMLAAKRVDYVVFEEKPGLDILKSMDINNVKMLPFLVASEGIYLAIAKSSKCNTPELRAKLEAALKKVVTPKNLSTLMDSAQQQWLDYSAQIKDDSEQ